MALSVGVFYAVFFIGSKKIQSQIHQYNPEFLNAYILETLRTYPTDGTHLAITGKEVKTSYGTTKDLYYQGKCVIKGDPQKRCYCIGLIFEVYLSACEKYAQRNSKGALYELPGVDLKNFNQFRRSFYGADGNCKTFVDALALRGLGKEINRLEEAQPGDLIQFWRHNGTGHAAIFLSYSRNQEGVINKIKFWSVHAGSGISEKEEEIGDYKNSVDRNRIYIVRPYVPLY